MAHDQEPTAAGGGYWSPGTTPHSDSPGNPAWQRTRQMLAQVHAELDAHRRRN